MFHTARTSLDFASQERVAQWLQNPEKHSGRLIEMSKKLYKTSGEYKSMLNYFINMARFYYTIDPNYTKEDKITKAKITKELAILSKGLRKMNIKHEFAKIIKTCLLEDVYYGYEVNDKNNYFLLKLDPNFCRISGISDGMYTFEFNLNYFKGQEYLLDSYPREFNRAYILAKRMNNPSDMWFKPKFEKCACFKFNEDDIDIVPPFSVMFEPILELQDYKKLKKVGAKINNYMLLHQKVPMHISKDSNYLPDNYSISTESMDFFNDMVNESLPDEIGAVVSPMEITPIKLDKDDRNDKVSEATRDVYNASGVSSFIFNNDKNSTGGLSYAVRKDELLIINFYKQLERWLNRKIRFSNEFLSTNNWVISLLEVTGINEDKYMEQLMKSGTYGFAVRGRIAAMHGHDYHSLLNTLKLENEILDLDVKMIPLASSHTGGLVNGAGRPTKRSEELSDSGQANRDSNSNALKGGE